MPNNSSLDFSVNHPFASASSDFVARQVLVCGDAVAFCFFQLASGLV